MTSFPSTNITMLAEKMDLLVEQFGIEDFGGGDEAEHVYADIRRLAEQAAVNVDRSAWNDALVIFHRADQAWNDHIAAHVRPLIDEEQKRFKPQVSGEADAEELAWRQSVSYDAVFARDDELSDAYGKAWDALMFMPAPDLAALRWKLHHFVNEEEGTICRDGKIVADFVADYKRLLPEEKLS